MQIALVVVASLLILVVLVQHNKSDGMNSAFTGGSDLQLFSVTKDVPGARLLTAITYILIILFFVLAIFIEKL